MVFSIQAKNVNQKSTILSLSGTSAVIDAAGVLIYTCPAGKRAQGNASMALNSFGTATAVRMRAAGSKIINYDNTSIQAENPRMAPFSLNAGDTLRITANLGNTSGADWNVTLTELPA